MKIKEMSRGELAVFVCSQLIENGIDTVLSGGSCVSIYTSEEYVSYDLDFIQFGFLRRNRIKKVMKSLGFEEINRYFRHPDTKWYIEFPPGPPAIGEEGIHEVTRINYSTGILKILTPTDCVKDRLSWFYHDNDYQSLKHAVMVAKQHKILLNEVEHWSKNEGKLKEFQYFWNILITVNK